MRWTGKCTWQNKRDGTGWKREIHRQNLEKRATGPVFPEELMKKVPGTALSDLSGSDRKNHDDEPIKLTKVVRD